jgi:hypothetical protein
MKALSPKLLIAVIAILFATNVNAQKNKKRNSDYVITPKGDTMACVITIPMLGKDTYTTMTDGTEDLTPQDIKEYYISTKKQHYQSVYRPGETKPVFLNALEIGKINLYEDPTPNSVTGGYSAVWYVSKGIDNNKITGLNRRNLTPSKPGEKKNELEQMLADNKDVYNAYRHDKKYTFDQLRSFIHLYNTGVMQVGWPKTYDH